MTNTLILLFSLIVPFAAPLSDSETCQTDNCTLPIIPRKSNFSNDNCWCDLFDGKCDINCCCDLDCLDDWKQVFTECAELKKTLDPNLCYATDILSPNNSYATVVQHDGLFCIVRKNLAEKREYKSRSIIFNLNEFDKSLKNRKIFSYHSESDHSDGEMKYKFGVLKAGEGIGLIIDDRLQYLELPVVVIDKVCSAKKQLKFLQDESIDCQSPNSHLFDDILKLLTHAKFVIKPNLINKTNVDESVKNCIRLGLCAPPEIQICEKLCTNYNSSMNVNVGQLFITIIHNGTNGIETIKIRVEPKTKQQYHHMNVKFLFVGELGNPEFRSGNPGYLLSRPIPIGRAALDKANSSKETINKIGFLERAGTGNCKNIKKIEFGFNLHSQCLLTYQPIQNFTKGCIELGQLIKELLIIQNLTNLYVATFGNIDPLNILHWVPILKLESETAASSFQTFDGVYCKNLITFLNIDILYSLYGDFANPQPKISGVRFQFNKVNNILYQCAKDKFCTNTVKLTTSVNFIDLTKPAVREFAQPPGLNIKFPHDFFYPFFAGKSSHIACTSSFLMLFTAFVSFML